MANLQKYSLVLFREKIAVIPGVDGEDLDVVNLWWRGFETKTLWVARFKVAVENVPTGTPEKVDARAAFRGCDIYFQDVNETLASLLRLPDDNFVMKTWIRPALSIFGKVGLKRTLFDETVKLIRSFQNRYESVENDQIIAVCEAIVESGGSRLDLVRTKVAQWAFEEFLRNFKIFELKVKLGGIETPSTVDELEIEKREIADALASDPWKLEVVRVMTENFGQIRKAMDLLDFETEVKTGFNRVIAYATDHVGLSVSAIDILRNIEAVWRGFVNDDTLEEFWENEQEVLEEEVKE